jgi:Prophage minor tail protein Z (GPZ).
MIEVSTETIQRVEMLLAGVPNGTERALANAINRGSSRLKTGASKKVREVYAIQSSAINGSTNTKIQKASTRNLAGFISFAGYKIPLYKFKVTPKAPNSKRKVVAAVKKGGGTTFEEAFVAELKSGHVGIFERKTSKRFPIEEKMGLAMAQMVRNKDIVSSLEKEAQETVNQRIEHEIDRLLNGYGGRV